MTQNRIEIENLKIWNNEMCLSINHSQKKKKRQCELRFWHNKAIYFHLIACIRF